MTGRDIHRVIRILRREVARWSVPVVGVVAEESRDPFRILVACLLSLRTRDATTAEASQRLFALAPDAAKLAVLPVRTIERAIYPVGFYRTKARRLRMLARILLDRFGGAVPASIETLLELPGVGRKTANLVVTLGFGKPGICVDTHVHRITNRWGYLRTRTPEKTEQALRKKLPRRYWIEFNDLLVPYGQHLCQPISPWCSRCSLADLCNHVGVTRSR